MHTLLILLISFFNTAHPLYFSNTYVKHVPEVKAVKISFQIFDTDIQDIMQLYYKMSLEDPNQARVNGMLDRYLKENFKLTIDNKDFTQQMKFQKRTKNLDAYIIDYVVQNVDKAPKTISAECTFLLDMFPEQTNIINFVVGGKTKTFPLKEDNILAKASF